jgi:hypothetical protein
MRAVKFALAAVAIAAAGTLFANAQQAQMTFFVTSAGSGDGANLGGIAGADAICAQLASAAGATATNWKAYLSTTTENARDRIGAGPWVNAKGEQIAASVDELHSDANKITKQTALTEKGTVVNGRGDEPNQHDILTGSKADGTVDGTNTCGDWTSSGEGAAMVGHSDRMGPADNPTGSSWNASHLTRGGCGQQALIGTGGAGYFYCFAAN